MPILCFAGSTDCWSRGIPILIDPSTFHTDRLELFDLTWQKRRTPSGLTVIQAPLAHADQFFLGAMIKAGSRLEKGPHQSGVSHFLEHMMFRGCRRYPEFAALAMAFESLGGDWNAATGQEHTEYWYSGIRHTAKEIIELFADFLAAPCLTDVEVERSIILRELDGETNDHGHSIDLDYHVATLFWPGTTAAQPIIGNPQSLAAIDVPALRRYRDAYYVPANMAVCAVGGDQSLMTTLETAFADFRAEFTKVPREEFDPLPPFKGPAVKWIEHSDNEYELKLSFICGGEWSPEAPVYEAITRVLGDGFSSRLARRLREELGLVYDVHAATALGLEVGSIDVTATCSQDGLDEFLRELMTLLKTCAAQGPAPDEMLRVLVRGVVDAELAISSPEAMGTRLAWSEVVGRPLRFAAERDKFKSVTAAQVQSVCQRLFRPENAALAVLGPPGRDIEKRLRKALMQWL